MLWRELDYGNVSMDEFHHLYMMKVGKKKGEKGYHELA